MKRDPSPDQMRQVQDDEQRRGPKREALGLGRHGGVGRHILADVLLEGLLQLLHHRTWSAGDLAAVDFRHSDQIAVRGCDENFLGGIEVFGQQPALLDALSHACADVQEHGARHAFQAA